MLTPHPVTRLSVQQIPARTGHVRLVLGMLLWLVWALRRRSVLLRLRADAAQAMTQARTDPLTGLGNRAALQEILTSHLGRVSMLGIIDLDDFKPVNDQYGHHAGDHVLQVVAGRLREVMTANGSAYRLGGDEFAILWHPSLPPGVGGAARAPESMHPQGSPAGTFLAVPGALAPRTVTLATSTPEMVGAQVLAAAVNIPIHLGRQELPVGASLGLAVNDGSLSGADLLRMADAAMYEAKDRTHRQPGRGSGDPAGAVRTVTRGPGSSPSAGPSSSGSQGRAPESAPVSGIRGVAGRRARVDGDGGSTAPLDPVIGIHRDQLTRSGSWRGRRLAGPDRSAPARLPSWAGLSGEVDQADQADQGPGRAGTHGVAPTGSGRGTSARVIVHPTLAERRYGARGQSGSGR